MDTSDYSDYVESDYSEGAFLASVSDAADITVVTTPRELQAAVSAGVLDIQIEAHLDLSAEGGLALAYYVRSERSGSAVLAHIGGATRSIRGKCATPPDAASSYGLSGEALNWRAGQCLIIADHDLFFITHRLWLDSLLIRAKPSQWSSFFFLVLDSFSELYATDVTLQSDGQWNTTLVYMYDGGARAYMEGCEFDSVGGSTRQFQALNSSLVVNGSSFSDISKSRSALSRIPLSDAGPYAGQYISDGIFAVYGNSASVVILDSTFSNVTASNIFWAVDEGLVVADGLSEEGPVSVDLDQVYRLETGGLELVEDASVLRGSLVGRVTPPAASDAWFVAAQEALTTAGPANIKAAPVSPPNPPPPAQPWVDGSAAPEVAAVYTAAQLQRAFHAGVRDIEIRAHLDLQGLPAEANPITARSPGVHQLGWVGRQTRSVRGRCADPPPASLGGAAAAQAFASVGEEPWAAPRCVLVTASRPFLVDRPGLWLDSLHIKIPYDADEDTDPVALIAQDGGSAYVSNCVVQSDGYANAIGLWAYRSPGLYVRDSVFAGLRGEGTSRFVIQTSFSTASFESCVFRDLGEALAPEADDVRERLDLSGTISAAGLNTTLAMKNCTLEDMQSEWPISVEQAAGVYSDDPAHSIVYIYDRETAPPQPLAALEGRSARQPPPLQADDPWFVDAQQALASPPLSAYLEEYPLSEGDTAAITATAPAPAPAPDPAVTAGPPRSTTPPPTEAVAGTEELADAPAPGGGGIGTEIDISAGSPADEIEQLSPDPDSGPWTQGVPPDTPPVDDESGLSTGVLIAIFAAGLAAPVLVAACIVYACVRVKRRKKREAGTGGGSVGPQAAGAGQPQANAAGGHAYGFAPPAGPAAQADADKPPAEQPGPYPYPYPYPPGAAPGQMQQYQPAPYPDYYGAPARGHGHYYDPNMYQYPPGYGAGPYPPGDPYMYGQQYGPPAGSPNVYGPQREAPHPPAAAPHPSAPGFWLSPPLPNDPHASGSAAAAGSMPGPPQPSQMQYASAGSQAPDAAPGAGSMPGPPQPSQMAQYASASGDGGCPGGGAAYPPGGASLAADSASDVTQDKGVPATWQ